MILSTMRKSKHVRMYMLTAIFLIVTFFLAFYFYQSYTKPERKLLADINQDGITNETDYTIFLQKYGQSCIECREDINNDSLIDGNDMLVLLGELNESR